MIGASNLVVVTGDSGVGKSALVKAVIEAEEASGAKVQAMMLNPRQMLSRIAELRAWLGQPIERLLGELSAPNRILVIDAADSVLEPGDEMLRALANAAHSAGVSSWVVSATEGLAALPLAAHVDTAEFSAQQGHAWFLLPATLPDPAARARRCSPQPPALRATTTPALVRSTSPVSPAPTPEPVTSTPP